MDNVRQHTSNHSHALVSNAFPVLLVLFLDSLARIFPSLFIVSCMLSCEAGTCPCRSVCAKERQVEGWPGCPCVQVCLCVHVWVVFLWCYLRFRVLKDVGINCAVYFL
jgi:hypothetical protein